MTSPKIEITGGAGPYEAAAILAAVQQILAEEQAAAVVPPARPEKAAWVKAVPPGPPRLRVAPRGDEAG